MHGWIVDSISMFFRPHSITEQRCTNWPRKNNLHSSTAGTLGGQLQENLTRAVKRNYQSVHSSYCRVEHLDVKRPKIEKQMDRALLYFQKPPTRKHNGNPEKTKAWSQQQPLQLLPSRPALSNTEPSVTALWSQSHKRQLSVDEELLEEVSKALGQNDPNLVLSSAFKLRITQRDLATLGDGSWLNDEVINFYMNLVMSRSEQDGGRKVFAFSTFIFPKLRVGGHAAVRRWTKAVDIFLYDIILVPLHLEVHWCLAVIDVNAMSVMCYDSMGQSHDDICSLLLLYVKDEHETKKCEELEISQWVASSLQAYVIPQQSNGSDCGVFTCKYADCIARGEPLTVSQSHMSNIRIKNDLGDPQPTLIVGGRGIGYHLSVLATTAS